MKRRLLWLTSAASLVHSSPHVFSANDDLLAYPQVSHRLLLDNGLETGLTNVLPQYDIVFSESYISDKEASIRLSYASSNSATRVPPASIPPHESPSSSSSSSDQQQAGLSPIAPHDQQRSHSPTDPLSGNSISPDRQHQIPDTYERMILDSRPYLCSIPQAPHPSTNATSSQRAAEEEAAELARATDRGWDLLQEMSGKCLYFISGWWSYSFCYAQSVKQFHPLPPGKGGAPVFPPVEDPTTPSYVLGRFGDRRVNAHRSGMAGAIDGRGGSAEKEAGLGMEDGTGETTQIQAKGTSNSRYLSQKLSGGTTCDLTGAPRRVEIQFHCHPQSHDRIGWIREVSTCSYLMMVYTPRLCNDVAFSPPREEKAEQIVCREVVAEGEYHGWEDRKRRDAERKLVGDTAEAARKNKPIIGGTEVGGMKLVGGEGRRLEPPQNIQPGSHGHGHPQNGGSGAGEGGSGSSTGQTNSGDPPTVKIELIAKMDPDDKGGKVQRLSDDELRKLGLDVQVVDLARRRLEAMADGKKWRLEAFTVDGMWEMRGIVDGDGQDGDGVGYEDEYTFEEVDEGYIEDPEYAEGDLHQQHLGNPRGDDEDFIAEGGAGEEENQEYPGSQEEYRDEL